MLKDSTTQEERGVRMSKKRYEIVSYDIPLWLKPVLSVTETSIYTGISANKIYEMSESEDCPFVIWIGSQMCIRDRLSIMKNGEHWFHTDEQMKFLDEWIIKSSK